jgi:hypothetical protein
MFEGETEGSGLMAFWEFPVRSICVKTARSARRTHKPSEVDRRARSYHVSSISSCEGVDKSRVLARPKRDSINISDKDLRDA